MNVKPGLMQEFSSAVKDAIISSAGQKRQDYLTGTVTQVDTDGTVWVDVTGGVRQMPIVRATADCNVGDLVSFTIENGVASLGGNVTDMAAGQRSVNSVETRVTMTENIIAEKADIQELNAQKAWIEELEADTAKIHDLTADQLTATTAYIDDLAANNVTAQNITAASGYIGTLTANSVTAQDVIATKAAVGSLDANYAHITNGVIDNAKIGYADVNDLDANYAHIDMANVDNAWISQGTIKDGAISSAMINSVSANKLTAGTINGSVINVTNLNADNITTGTINGQRIGAGSLSLDKLSEDVYTEAEVDSKLAAMQAEIDGAIETWTGTDVPTLNNAPASGWMTAADRDKHVGDVYFVVNSQSQQSGYNYRFTKSGNAYSWQLIKDTDITNALQRIQTAEGKITTFDSDISTLKTDTGELKTKTQSLETSLGDKVDTTTFNELEDTVDGHSQTLTQHTTAISNKADSSTVTAVTNRVSKNEQDISGINTTIGTLQTTVASKADNSTVTTISNKLNTVSDTVDGHTQTLSSVQSTLSGKADNSTVTTISNKLNTVSDTVDGHTETLSSVQTAVAGKADNSTVATLCSEYNETKTTVSGHETRLSATESVANGVRADFDNLEVGGRNLLQGSAEFSTDFYKGTGTYASGGYSSTVAMTADRAWHGAHVHLGDALTRANAKIGDVYTLSVYIRQNTEDVLNPTGGSVTLNWGMNRVTRSGTEKCHIDGGTFETYPKVWDMQPGVWYRAWCSFEVTDYSLSATTTRFESNNAVSHSISAYKLEKGNKPTDWTPAPEDIQTEVTTLKADYATYKQTTNEALSEIGTTYATKTELGTETSNRQTAIQQVNNAIALKANASDVYTKTQADGNVSSAITAAKAEIKVTTDGISTEVAKKVGASEVISKINQSAESVTINANRVNVEGAAIFTGSGRLSQTSLNGAYDAKGAASTAVSNLTTDLASSSGTTVIDGGHITANSLAIGNFNSTTQSSILNSNVKVGGRNLLAYSGTGKNWEYSTFADGVYTRSTTATSESFVRGRTVEPLTLGETYTFSAWMKTNGQVSSAEMFLYDYNGKTVRSKNLGALTTSWARYTWTVTMPASWASGTDTANPWFARFDNNGSKASGTEAILYVKQPKLEIGNKATDWTPSPEDVDAAVDGAAKTATNYISADSSGIRIASANPATATTYQHQTATKTEFVVGGASMTEIGGDGLRLGKANASHLNGDYHSIQLVSKEGNTYFHVSDLRDTTGYAQLAESFIGDGSTKAFTVSQTVNSVVSAKVNGSAVTVSSTSNKTVTLASAPASGASVVITYKTSSPSANAFTFGSRKSGSGIGARSFAAGFDVTASNSWSHAEGYQTTASGSTGHSEGFNTTASGPESHAEGDTTTASNWGSHAEGNRTTASGSESHAEGSQTTASGGRSHAEGTETTASNWNSHAEGWSTTASGHTSHAEGWLTTASGSESHAQNTGTIAASQNQTALGRYNVRDAGSNYAVIVGNGTSDTDRSNALAIAWDGTTWAAGGFHGFGGVYIQTTSTDAKISKSANNGVSSNTMFGSFNTYDANGVWANTFAGRTGSSGEIVSYIGARNMKTDGTWVNNFLNVWVYKNGSMGYSVTDPGAFRNALGASSGVWPASQIPSGMAAGKIISGSTSTASDIITAGSGVTIVSAAFSYWGKVATVNVAMKYSSAIGSGNISNITLGTIKDGKRPSTVASFTTTGSGPVFVGYINQSGSVIMSATAGAISANTEFSFSSTYVLN